MNLNINLATRVYINNRQVNLFLALAFLICLGWMAFNIIFLVADLEQMNRYEEFMARRGRGGAGKVVTDEDYNKFLARVKNVNTILYKRSYDWLSLLENLEQVVPAGVSLRSLQPANKGESLTLNGTATDFSAVRRFMENLENSKEFTEIYLTNQASIMIDNKRKAINFSVTCKASIP